MAGVYHCRLPEGLPQWSRPSASVIVPMSRCHESRVEGKTYIAIGKLKDEDDLVPLNVF